MKTATPTSIPTSATSRSETTSHPETTGETNSATHVFTTGETNGEANGQFRDQMIREVRVQYLPTNEPAFNVCKPEDVAEFVRRVLYDNSRQHLIALFLDAAHQVVSFSIVSIGTATTSLMHPREVFQRAIGVGAVALVIAHNHPSGNTTPSREDFCCTDRLQEAGELLGIALLDHVIVTHTAYFSFKEENVL